MLTNWVPNRINVVDRYRFDAALSPDQTYHFDPDPNPDHDATPNLKDVGKSDFF
jgi:hypothetical protein